MGDGSEKPTEIPQVVEPPVERRDDEPSATVAPLRRRSREPVAVEPPDGGAPDAA